MRPHQSTVLLNHPLLRNPARLYSVVLIMLLAITASWPMLESQSFADRTIGAFALSDVNLGSRNILNMLGIGIAFCFLSLLFWLRGANIFSRLRFSTLASSRESPAYLVYTLIIANTALYLYSGTPVYLAAMQILVILCVAHVLLSKLLARGSTLAERVWILGLSYQLTLGLQLLATGHAEFDGTFITGFVIFVAALSYSLRIRPTIIHWAYPLVWLPIVPILASELTYFLLRRLSYGADFNTTCAALSALLALWSAYRWHRVSAGGAMPGSAPSFVFRRYLLPIVITSTALAEYAAGAVLKGINYDYFHLGELTSFVHQTIQYGAIPYIDYYPTHGLFDLFPQTIYSLIFGTQVLEATAWGHGYMFGWVPRLVAGIIFFAFFSRFWGRLPTALIMLFLPTYHLIHPYYCFLLIPGLFIYRLPPIPLRFAPWFHLWLAVLAVGLWRVDFGIAAGLGCLSVALLSAWQQQNWRILLIGISSAALVVLFLLITFTTMTLLKGHSPLAVLVQLVQYVRIQIPVTSYVAFIREIDLTALLQLLGLPLLGVLALVLSANKCFFLLRPLNRLERLLPYLAVISLTMSFRSLHRHSLYVGVFNQYFFVFIGLALLCYLPRKHFRSALIVTVAIIALTQVFLPTTKHYLHHIYHGYQTENQYLLVAHDYEFPRWSESSAQGSARLYDTVEDQRNGIVRFLQQNLNANQTFYDFTNSPLLYALVDREAPNYVLETLYHSSDTTQNFVLSELEQLRNQSRLPIVLFRYNGAGSLENVDGVNTVLRSYRIAEYIYQHYQPCVQIGDYDIWVEQQSPLGQSCSSLILGESATGPQTSRLDLTPPVQQFASGFLPLIWAQRDPYCAVCQPLIQHWDFPANAAQMWSLDLPGNLSKRAVYLVLEMTAKQDSTVEVRYGESYLSMNMRATDQPQAYVVRLSVLHAWWRDSTQEIKISSDHPISLISANLREGD